MISVQSPQMMRFAFVVASILVIVVLGICAMRLVKRSLHLLEEKDYLSESTCLLLQGVVRWAIIIAVALLGLQYTSAPPARFNQADYDDVLPSMAKLLESCCKAF